MKILVVEDNVFKQQKVLSFLENAFHEFKVDTAASYNSAIKITKETLFDILILDMSLPTYNKSSSESGGKFRTFGGVEVLRKLKRKNKLRNFVLLTGFDAFSRDGQTVTIENIELDLASDYSGHFKGLVFYNSSSTEWEINLLKIINKMEMEMRNA